MNRRSLIKLMGATLAIPFIGQSLFARQDKETLPTEKLVLTDNQWRERLTPAQFHVLREEGTERPRTSPLLHEQRKGIFACVACDQHLFSSSTKFESGTGWPSFYDFLPGALETKRDLKLIWPRTEYHCSHCGGHQGHVFNDGPKPTGLRYCNNGIALKFIAAEV